MVLHNHVKNKIRYELFFLFLLIICVWVEMNVWGVQSHLPPFRSFLLQLWLYDPMMI